MFSIYLCISYEMKYNRNRNDFPANKLKQNKA